MTRQWTITATRLAGLGLLGLLLMGAAGCKKGTAVVSGKIKRSDGKAIETGNIIFYAKDGRSATAIIKKDGSYRMPDAPVGEVKVVIQPPPQRPNMMGGGMNKRPEGQPGMPAEFVPQDGAGGDQPSGNIIPFADKFKSKDDTPLEYNVEKGEHEQDFEVTL